MNTAVTKGRPPRYTMNPLASALRRWLQYHEPDFLCSWKNYRITHELPTWLDDILNGAARLDTTGKKGLHLGKLIRVLCIDKLCTEALMNGLQMSASTSARYFSAARVLIQTLEYNKERLQVFNDYTMNLQSLDAMEDEEHASLEAYYTEPPSMFRRWTQ